MLIWFMNKIYLFFILVCCVQSHLLPFSGPVYRACLHGGGGPQVGEVTRLGGVTRLSIQSLILI